MAPGYSEYNHPQPRARWGQALRGAKVIRTAAIVLVLIFLTTFIPTPKDGPPRFTRPSPAVVTVTVEYDVPSVPLETAAIAESGMEFPTPSTHVQPIQTSVATHMEEHLHTLPDPVPSRSPIHTRYFTIATMLKNQRRWLREWIEFYTMMGADHFILYDNGSTDFPLEILQHYIDAGIVTYIPWPPISIPPPPLPFKTQLEEWQYSWFNDVLETCLSDDWIVHKQVPCQLAAFADAIRRTRGGVSRWLGLLDVDEYIFPRSQSGYERLVELLWERNNTDSIRIFGNTFGTSGHIEHAAQRKPGDALHALLTESYTLRSREDEEDAHPYAWRDYGEGYEVHGKGQLGDHTFAGAAPYVIKSFVDPDMVSHCFIHYCSPTARNSETFVSEVWGNDNQVWRFNHYAYLSLADARRKSQANKNPFIKDYDEAMDEYFSRVEDTEVLRYVPALKNRMERVIGDDPPVRPDDWEPLLLNSTIEGNTTRH